MRRTMLAGVAMAAFLGAAADVGAQGVDKSAKDELKKTDTLPPATAPNLSEQAGTTEPSSKVPSSKDEDAFRNGVLAALGAQTDVDTAPSKFSARTTADDSLPISGYRMKQITIEQGREIAQRLGADKRASAEGLAVVGREVPAAVAAEFLKPVPEELSTKFVELRGTGFMKSDGKLIIVDLDNSVVVGVLEG